MVSFHRLGLIFVADAIEVEPANQGFPGFFGHEKGRRTLR
jgi:hypothetical protein